MYDSLMMIHTEEFVGDAILPRNWDLDAHFQRNNINVGEMHNRHAQQKLHFVAMENFLTRREVLSRVSYSILDEGGNRWGSPFDSSCLDRECCDFIQRFWEFREEYTKNGIWCHMLFTVVVNYFTSSFSLKHHTKSFVVPIKNLLTLNVADIGRVVFI